jgi:hypothetical protein
MTRALLGLALLLIAADGEQKRAISYLTRKIEEARPRAGQMADGEQNLSALTAALAKLQDLAATSEALSKELEAQKSRIHNFEVTDLRPKERAAERIELDYRGVVEAAQKGRDDFFRANNNKYPEGSPEHRSAQLQYKQLVDRYEALVRERDEKMTRAIQTYAAAQKEYGALTVKRDRLQNELAKSSEEFTSVQAGAMERVRLLDTALYQARQAARVAEGLVAPGGAMSKKRPSGYVFDDFVKVPPADLPDPPPVDGRPAEMILPPAPPTEKTASPRMQGLQRERAAVQELSRTLEGMKARLFADKNATPEMWKEYADMSRKISVQAAEIVIQERGLGGTQTMDADELDLSFKAKPQKEGSKP